MIRKKWNFQEDKKMWGEKISAFFEVDHSEEQDDDDIYTNRRKVLTTNDDDEDGKI